MRSALDTLKLDRLDIIHAGSRTFPLDSKVGALAASDLLSTLAPLRKD